MDCFIFGHRHLPLDIPLGDSSRYINLGEWLSQNTFLKISPQGIELLQFNNGQISTYQPINKR